MCAPGLRSRARTRKKWRWNVVERIPEFTNWLKDDAFLAEKARCKAVFRVDLSDIPLTHRRDRIEVGKALDLLKAGLGPFVIECSLCGLCVDTFTKTR